MGKRDFSHKEAKKPRKGAKQIITMNTEAPPPVEVIKRGKKEKPEEE